MHIEQLTPMLRTWDIPATIDFYRRVLGFDCKVHDVARGWASLTHGPITIMLSGPNAREGDVRPLFTGSLYFRVDDVDEIWSRVKDHARISYRIENFDYGMREFAVYDNNGYLLQFGSPIAHIRA